MLGAVGSAWWVLVLVGLGAGILSGLLGIGSGVVMIPVLVLILTLPQKAAQGIALSVMVPMALVGAVRYWMNPDLDLRFMWVLFITLGAVVGAWFGADVASRMPGELLRKIFAVFIIVIGFYMLATPEGKPARPPGDSPAASETTAPSAKGETK